MKKVGSSLLKPVVLAAPLLFGAVGLLRAGESVLNALFNSVCMYTLNYQETPPNIWVEIGRWGAPLATASGLIWAVRTVREKLRTALRGGRGDSVAVYGPEAEAEPLLEQLGRRGIRGKERLVKARQYILVGAEEENLAFYAQNQRQLAGKEVFLKCGALSAQSVAAPELYLFNPEETAARLFWKGRGLYERARQNRFQLKILFLGFGKLGEELLTSGLQNNIYAPDQCLEYHIFGGGGRFSAVHTRLDQISDPVLFHPEPWYEALSLLEEADMVLVLEQKDQLALLRDLLRVTCRARFQVFAAEPVGARLLAGGDRLDIFLWRQQAQTLEHILNDSLLARAKSLNLRYAHLYSHAPENEQEREKQWRRLDAFTRYSNISAADYHQVRLEMMGALGIPEDAARISPEQMELLAELEHIRWCRYHYLWNWSYGIPLNGETKDPKARLHGDLLPYEKLPEKEKEKDRENIRILLSLQ